MKKETLYQKIKEMRIELGLPPEGSMCYKIFGNLFVVGKESWFLTDGELKKKSQQYSKKRKEIIKKYNNKLTP